MEELTWLEKLEKLANDNKDKEDVKNGVETINAIGEIIREQFGDLVVAQVGMKWAENLLKNKTSHFVKDLSEIIKSMAEVSKTQHEMDVISSGITKIAMEQLIETEELPSLLDDLTSKNSARAMETLRAGLNDGHGIIISDTLVEPNRHKDGTLTANAKYDGFIMFGHPENETGDFIVRTILPSLSDPLNLAEREEFRIPLELLLLAFSKDETNARFISIKENGETKGKLFNTKNIDDLNFSSRANRKTNKLKELIENRNKMGYELIGFQVIEQPEEFTDPVTKETASMNATNSIGVFLKRGASKKMGNVENLKDEIIIEGWRFSEYDKKFGPENEFVVTTNISQTGWTLKRMAMENSLDLLKEFADKNWDSYVEKVSERDSE